TAAARAAFLAVGALVVAQVVAKDPSHPLHGGYGRPWQLSQVDAAYLTDEPHVGDAVAALGGQVPARACVGAGRGCSEPASFLGGPRLARRVVYLPVADALDQAYRRSLSYVVVSRGQNRWATDSFRQHGWRIGSLGGYWLLAVAPRAGAGDCTA